jgi:hypothetical protein
VALTWTLERAFPLPEGYTRSFAQLDEGVYWHLSCGDTRINGGLAENFQQARLESRHSALAHYWSSHSFRYGTHSRCDDACCNEDRWEGQDG